MEVTENYDRNSQNHLTNRNTTINVTTNTKTNAKTNAGFQPGSLEELKGFVAQFAMLLPEEKRNAILHTIAQLEETGGVQSEAQGQQILQELLSNLGIC